MTAVSRKDRVEAPGRAGRPGTPEDRIRPRWWWVPVGLAVVVSAGLQIAVVMNVRGRIASAEGPSPAPSRAANEVSPAGDAELTSKVPLPAVPGSPKPKEGRPGTDGGEVKERRPADEIPRPPVAEPVGPPKPVEQAPEPAADPIALGRELFARTWRPDDARCHGGDGLGPVYNATSCVDCHNQGGPGGGGPGDRNVQLVTGIGYMIFSGNLTVVVDRRGNSSRAAFDQMAEKADLVKVHPGFRDASSAVLHRFGVDPGYDGWRSTFLGRCRTGARVPVHSSGHSGFRDQDRLLKILFHNQEPERPYSPVRAKKILERELAVTVQDVENGLGMNRVAFRLSARNTPTLFGAGLIDGVSESELDQLARDQPKETRGEVHRLRDGRLGRFGWKAQVARLEDFVLAACANELGLEVPGHHQPGSPLAPDATARGLDLTAEECYALVDYVRTLAPLVSLKPPDAHGAADVAEGRELFHSTGCARCHVADLGSIRGIYSDLLLHDMGEELSDTGSYFSEETEADKVVSPTLTRHWRTPPLWGFRDTAPYLHDGRARNLEEAVAMHHGQGKASALKFRSMSGLERSRVEAFLKSLGVPAARESGTVEQASR